MNSTEPIITRISRKLKQAKAADPELRVFGASSHRYEIGPPLSPESIRSFEEKFGITLPEGYRSFVSGVGNGNGDSKVSAAGPFYGIYPLGYGIDELTELSERSLANPCLMSPEMPEQEWLALVDEMGFNGELSDEDYLDATSRLYGGLLPLGSQGCSFHHYLVLNGPQTGRVVNVDLEYGCPKFAYEPDFLAWYERWLDEVTSGDLFQAPSWFGYQKGGPESLLLAEFTFSADMDDREVNLQGLLYKRKLAAVTLEALATSYFQHPEHASRLCQIVCKSDYERSKPLLADLAKLDALSFLKCLYWYARGHASDWQETILANGTAIQEIETFRFFTYLVAELNIDHGAYLSQYIDGGSKEIREQAIYALEKARAKK